MHFDDRDVVKELYEKLLKDPVVLGEGRMGGAFTIEQAAILATLALTDADMDIVMMPVAHAYAVASALIVTMHMHEQSTHMSALTFKAANVFAGMLDTILPGAGDALQAFSVFLERDIDEEEES